MDTVAIFCAIDDFCNLFEPWWRQRLLVQVHATFFAIACLRCSTYLHVK
jgi:hypothetical protein